MLRGRSPTGEQSEGAAPTLPGAWEDARTILLAVSGGPDSVGMMLIVRDWARALAGAGRAAPRIYIATVDHGLREGSRAEAQSVARWARDAGFPHKILAWDGEKPPSRVQERAREARYRLLLEFASEIGAEILATAHHADDQAETILFRLLRGSGVAGLAGMTALAARGGLRHWRPFLSCAKADLVGVCERAGHPFFTDPSNADPAFARTRVRGLARVIGPEGLDRDALLRLGRRAARAEAAIAAQAQATARRLSITIGPGRVGLDPAGFDEPEEIFLRLLSRLIREVGGGARPRLDGLERLGCALRQARAEERAHAATLAGAALRLDSRGRLTVEAQKPRRARSGASAGG